MKDDGVEIVEEKLDPITQPNSFEIISRGGKVVVVGDPYEGFEDVPVVLTRKTTGEFVFQHFALTRTYRIDGDRLQVDEAIDQHAGYSATGAYNRVAIPADLDRKMFVTGMSQIKPRVMACAKKSSAEGKVTVRVTVANDGTVSAVAVEAAPEPTLGACVESVVWSATFARTTNGGTYTFPFLF